MTSNSMLSSSYCVEDDYARDPCLYWLQPEEARAWVEAWLVGPKTGFSMVALNDRYVHASEFCNTACAVFEIHFQAFRRCCWCQIHVFSNKVSFQAIGFYIMSLGCPIFGLCLRQPVVHPEEPLSGDYIPIWGCSAERSLKIIKDTKP